MRSAQPGRLGRVLGLRQPLRDHAEFLGGQPVPLALEGRQLRRLERHLLPRRLARHDAGPRDRLAHEPVVDRDRVLHDVRALRARELAPSARRAPASVSVRTGWTRAMSVSPQILFEYSSETLRRSSSRWTGRTRGGSFRTPV